MIERFRATPAQFPVRLTLTVAAAAFGAELLVVLLLSCLPPLPIWLASLFDASVTTLIALPALSWLLFRPLEQWMQERRQVQQALRESEESYRLLFEGNPHPMWVVDTETLAFLAVNESAIQHYGYSRQEFTEMTLKDIRPPEDVPALIHNVRHVADGTKGTWRHRKKDGTYIRVEITSRRLQFAGRQAALALANDITKRELAEAYSQTMSALLRLLPEISTRQEYLDAVVQLLQRTSGCSCVGIRILNHHGLVPFESYLGFSPEFWAAENWLSVEQDHCACLRVITGHPLPGDRAAMTPAGSFYSPQLQEFGRSIAPEDQVHYRGQCLASGFGCLAIVPMRQRDQILGAIHLADPVPGKLSREVVALIEAMAPLISHATRKLDMADELRASETRYRIVADNTYDWEFWLDPAGEFLFTSPSCQRLTGHPPQAFQADSGLFLRLLHPDDRAGYERHWRELCVQPRPGEHEFRIVHADGRVRWFSHVCTPVYDSAGKFLGVRGSNRDVTEHKLAEEEVRQSREQLRALAGRLEAVREEERSHVAREIHDVLAQELTRLKLDIAWLGRRLAQPVDPGKQKLLQEKLQQMTGLTNTAIEFVQRIATELRPVVLDSLGLCAAIEWQVTDFQSRTGISCRLRLPPDLDVDRERSTALFRILQEALTNVLRHAGATRVETSLECGADQLLLTIRDNGCGLPADKLKDPRSVGLLGMRERALLLGGTCELVGRAGEGTTVQVRLPLPEAKL